MKKIIIIISLLLVAVCGYCQSPGDRMIASEGFKYFANIKQIQDTLQKKVEQAQLDSLKQQKEQEQKIIKIKKEAEPICIDITKNDKNKEDSKFICILKAVLLGGRFPWETKEEYRIRLEISAWPATQPSK